MEDEDGYFGERVAATYDGTSGVFGPGTVEATAGVLAELAGGGRALELAIGTGRIALPLARARRGGARHRAVPGHGRPGCAPSPAARTSRSPSATWPPPRWTATFSLAYLVFNTIMNLTEPGRAGRVLPQRRPPPGARRLLRHRVPGSRAAPASRRGRTCCPGMSARKAGLAYSYDPATQAMQGRTTSSSTRWSGRVPQPCRSGTCGRRSST